MPRAEMAGRENGSAVYVKRQQRAVRPPQECCSALRFFRHARHRRPSTPTPPPEIRHRLNSSINAHRQQKEAQKVMLHAAGNGRGSAEERAAARYAAQRWSGRSPAAPGRGAHAAGVAQAGTFAPVEGRNVCRSQTSRRCRHVHRMPRLRLLISGRI